MKTFRQRERALGSDDSGISLVEVLVAMMVFAIIALGVAYSLGTMSVQVRDARAREVASNLAAQEIDIARATGNLMELRDADRLSQNINGIKFDIHRASAWVTDSVAGGACGIGIGASTTGELQYKRVAVTVSWTSSGGGGRSVKTETLITPKARVSGAAQGTIIVSVRNDQGAGQPGVGITVTPTISPAPGVTDAEGCIYVTKVTPGAYTVKINAPSYLDPQQTQNPERLITVGAGKSGGAAFQIEKAQPLELKYGAVKIPKNLETALLHASDPVFSSVATNANASRTLSLYPFREGYQAIAGGFRAANEGTLGCLSPHPGMWPAGDRAGTYVAAKAPDAIEPKPGANISVGLGIVSFKTSKAASTTVYAESQSAGPAGSGDPGCSALTMKYQFDAIPSTVGATITLALPFGSWKLYYGTAASASQQISTGLVATTVNGPIVTLDPRVPTTPPVP